MFKRALVVLALFLSPLTASAQTLLSQGEITYQVGNQTEALDCANGYTALNPSNGALTQQWAYWQGASGINFLECVGGGNWNAIDFSQPGLPVDPIWDNASSGNAMTIAPAGNGLPMEIEALGQVLLPNAAGTAVSMETVPGWQWTAPPAAPPGPTPSQWVPNGYTMVFDDEFTSSQIDQNKWFLEYANPATANYIPSTGETEFFEEGEDGNCNHCMISGGGVALTAYGPRASDGREPSGMLRGKLTYNVGSATTGYYIEAKIKMPQAGGTWPADWAAAEPLVGSNGSAPWPPELDVAEFINSVSALGLHPQWNGNVPGPWNSIGSTYTWDGSHVPAGWSWSTNPSWMGWNTNVDFSQAYHTFALQIVPGPTGQNINPATGKPTHVFYMYVDGFEAETGTYDFQMGADGSCCYNLELLFDLAMGGQAGGVSVSLPTSMDIAYVRVYESGAKADPGDYVSAIGNNNSCGPNGC